MSAFAENSIENTTMLDVCTQGDGGSSDQGSLGDRMHPPLLLELFQKVYWLDDALQDRFESRGFPRLTRSDLFTLLNIGTGTTYATDIARNLGISRQAVSNKLIELEKRGMVVIKEDPEDRRSKIVSFTEDFQVNADLCIEFMQEIVASLEKAFGKRTMKNFQQVLSADWALAFQENKSKR